MHCPSMSQPRREQELRSAAQQQQLQQQRRRLFRRLLPALPLRVKRNGAAAHLFALAARGTRWACVPLAELLPAWLLGLAPEARDAVLHRRLRTYTAQLDERSSGALAPIVTDFDHDAARLLPALAARDDVEMLVAAMDCGAIARPKNAFRACAEARAVRCLRFLVDDYLVDLVADAVATEAAAVDRVTLMCTLATIAMVAFADRRPGDTGDLAATLRLLLADIAVAAQQTNAPEVDLSQLILTVVEIGNVASLRLFAAYGLRASRAASLYNVASTGRGLAALRVAAEWNGGAEKKDGNRFPCLRRWCSDAASADDYLQRPAFARHGDDFDEHGTADLAINFATRCGGNVACLRYLHRRWIEHNDGAPFPWISRVCSLAAKNGKLASLRYARENGCPWNEWTPFYAVAHGHVDCLRFALETGCPRNANELLLMMMLPKVKPTVEMIAMVTAVCAAKKCANVAATRTAAAAAAASK